MVYVVALPDAATLGPLLAQARLLSGLSQRELARRIGVSQRYIWEMESGEPTLFLRRLFDVMAATGTTLTATMGTDGATR